MDIQTNKISFSILMASYNSGKYIETAITSVICQTFNRWELIIIDDNSSDNSINLINNYLPDPRIKLLKHKINIGYGGTLKTAIEISQNEIIVILDADDKLHNEALKILANEYRKNSKYGFIYSSMWKCDSELKNCKLETHNPGESFIKNSNISHLKSFKRTAYFQTSGFDINQKRSVDKDIILKLEEVTDFKYLNKPLYYYRQHDAGISQGNNSYFAKWYFFRAKYKTYLRRKNLEIPNYTKLKLLIEYLLLKNYHLINLFINIIISIRLSIFLNFLYAKLNKYGLRYFLKKFKEIFDFI